jgi:hypothetical protein
MDKQQCVEHCHHLGCLEDVEFIEGELFKKIEETAYDTVWSVAMLACTDVVLLHDIVKDVGIGQYQLMVAIQIQKHRGSLDLGFCLDFIQLMSI